MSLHRLFIAANIALAFASAAQAQTDATAAASAAPAAPATMSVPPGGFTPETAKGFFTQYCVTCHNERAKTGGLVLDTRDLEQSPADAEIWEKVVRKLRAGMMPPRGMPRPEPRRLRGHRSTGSRPRSTPRAAANPNPGRSRSIG